VQGCVGGIRLEETRRRIAETQHTLLNRHPAERGGSGQDSTSGTGLGQRLRTDHVGGQRDLRAGRDRHGRRGSADIQHAVRDGARGTRDG